MEGDPIVARVEREAQLPGLAAALERLAPTDLQSLLLHVTRRRSAQRTPPQLTAAFSRDATVQPSDVDGRELHRLRGLALDAAGGFDVLELAPVCPGGLNTTLGGIDQNNALATVRGTEVVADPTTALALECAVRRRASRGDAVRLAALTRVLRLQPFDAPGFSPHFALLALVTAGRAAPQDGFELAALREQLAVHLRLLDVLRREGRALHDVRVDVCDTVLARAAVAESGLPDTLHEPDRELAPLAGDAACRRAIARLGRVPAAVFAPLRAAFPDVGFALRLTRGFALAYYEGLAVQILVRDADGAEHAPVDGGFTTWTERLLGDRKERLLVSGVGLEYLLRRFPPAGAPSRSP